MSASFLPLAFQLDAPFTSVHTLKDLNGIYSPVPLESSFPLIIRVAQVQTRGCLVLLYCLKFVGKAGGMAQWYRACM